VTLVEFLRACLDEDERDAQDIHDRPCDAILYINGESFFGPCDCGWPAKILADITAKRAVLDYCGTRPEHGRCGYCSHGTPGHESWCEEQWSEDIPRRLAQPYAGRPGWDGAWLIA
jgi:hypothetical protein